VTAGYIKARTRYRLGICLLGVFVIAAMGCILACRQLPTAQSTRNIPPGELVEIKTEAFKEASARYVISDPEIESRYKPASSAPCPETVRPQAPRRQRTLLEELGLPGCPEEEVRVEAVASVKGVQLTPLSRSECGIRFDFVASPNPHAKLPASREALAERFETATGYYWVVRLGVTWKP